MAGWRLTQPPPISMSFKNAQYPFAALSSKDVQFGLPLVFTLTPVKLNRTWLPFSKASSSASSLSPGRPMCSMPPGHGPLPRQCCMKCGSPIAARPFLGLAGVYTGGGSRSRAAGWHCVAGSSNMCGVERTRGLSCLSPATEFAMQPNAIITVLALSLFSSHAAGADLANDLLGVWRVTGVAHRVLQTGELEKPLGERPTGVATFSSGGYFTWQSVAEQRGVRPCNQSGRIHTTRSIRNGSLWKRSLPGRRRSSLSAI